MHTIELLNNSKELQKKSKQILEETDLISKLSSLGKVSLIGSYVYGVMFAKDIDMHVITNNFDRSHIMNFISNLISEPKFAEVILRDKVNFNKEFAQKFKSGKSSLSYYLELKYWYDNAFWSIGISILNQEQPGTSDFAEMFKTSSDEQKVKVLEFKQYLSEHNIKISSTTIYNAVFKENINRVEDFLNYLNKLGY